MRTGIAGVNNRRMPQARSRLSLSLALLASLRRYGGAQAQGVGPHGADISNLFS